MEGVEGAASEAHSTAATSSGLAEESKPTPSMSLESQMDEEDPPAVEDVKPGLAPSPAKVAARTEAG